MPVGGTRQLRRPTASRWVAVAGAALVLVALTPGCRTRWRAQFHKPDAPAPVQTDDRTFLKCHLRDGRVYVFEQWSVLSETGVIVGQGLGYDADRHELGRGSWTLPIERVALFETTAPERFQNVGGAIVLGITAGASPVVTALCVANPKACFGSCPTFYASDGEKMTLQAEGFSSAIARPLEATDVDSLYTARPRGRRFELLMTNEALETHLVRHVDLLAVRRPATAVRVVHAGDAFYPVERQDPPKLCRGATGDCLDAVRAGDELEYHRPTDPHDLAKREQLSLSFAAPPSGRRTALLVRARNSLVNTFLFYQALAYTGRRVGELMAQLERGDPLAVRALRGFGDVYGGIDVEVRTAAGWRRAGTFEEVGPIAHDVALVLLPNDLPKGPLDVRLTLAQGYWKIDQLALATVAEPLEPIRLPVERVTRHGRADREALRRLRDPARHLVTYPRDALRLHFRLPRPGAELELFVESRGYYIEWMREQWLREESPERALRMLADPRGMARELAPAYKRIEPEIEKLFWRSRLRWQR